MEPVAAQRVPAHTQNLASRQQESGRLEDGPPSHAAPGLPQCLRGREVHLGTLEQGNLGNAIFSFPAPRVQEDAPKEFQLDQSSLPAAQRVAWVKGHTLLWERAPLGKWCLLVRSSLALEQRTEGQLSCW